jgi:large conductance mechanosensitive channel
MLKEFKEFAVKGNMVDMAVGIIIGAAFGAVVKTLVDNIMMPPLGLLLGDVDFSSLFLVLKEGAAPGPYATVDAAKEAGAVVLGWGLLVNVVISFLVMAFAVFLLVKGINRLRRKQVEEPKKDPEPPAQEKLLAEIRDLLKERSNG